jgi:hypothetical protein
MEITTEFDEIRPYNNEELPQIYEELIADPAFQNAIAYAIPGVPFEAVANKMRSCKTSLEFQKAFSAEFLWGIAKKHTDGLTFDNSALTNQELSYTYISNHRDIILDSGFLSILLLGVGKETVEIAIGDNLLIYPWIKKLVRVNKSFIVQRGLSMRQILESSARMSRYMHYAIAEKKQSLWIAQREGRAKDSNDLTQDSVLKMLAMGGEGDIIERLISLNIAPLSISYEYDPCDYLKAKEFQLKRDVEGFKKTTQDDLKNMETGLFGFKGKVHLQAAACFNDKLLELDRTVPKCELFNRISTMIDKEIHRNYKIYPGNYIAHDLMAGEKQFADQYTTQEEQRFEEYIAGQINKIDLPEKDVAFLREKLLTMYANPLSNYLAAL